MAVTEISQYCSECDRSLYRAFVKKYNDGILQPNFPKEEGYCEYCGSKHRVGIIKSIHDFFNKPKVNDHHDKCVSCPLRIKNIFADTRIELLNIQIARLNRQVGYKDNETH